MINKHINHINLLLVIFIKSLFHKYFLKYLLYYIYLNFFYPYFLKENKLIYLRAYIEGILWVLLKNIIHGPLYKDPY